MKLLEFVDNFWYNSAIFRRYFKMHCLGKTHSFVRNFNVQRLGAFVIDIVQNDVPNTLKWRFLLSTIVLKQQQLSHFFVVLQRETVDVHIGQRDKIVEFVSPCLCGSNSSSLHQCVFLLGEVPKAASHAEAKIGVGVIGILNQHRDKVVELAAVETYCTHH